MRLAPLALAALVLTLAACTGGEPPPTPTAVATPEATPRATATAEATAIATPEVASTPTATATPEASPTPEATATPEASPTPEATATPTPRRGLEWIEPAPGVFEHRTFGDGEAIDWTHGIFVLDVETGLTEGYMVAGLESNDHWYNGHRLDGWIATEDGSWQAEWRLLLHRETGRSWRWPLPALSLMAASDEHLLFEELDDGKSTGSFILADSGLDEVARFSVDARDIHAHALFSPDGLAVALVVADTVYTVPVESGRPSVLFTAEPYDGEVEIWLQQCDTVGLRCDAAGLRVPVFYRNGGETERTEEHYFRWDGGALRLHTACPGTWSPDGRYVAVAHGAPYYAKYRGYLDLESPWPSITIADAETCAPIFRVRSAYWGQNVGWTAGWLSTSDGFVVGARGGYMVAQVGAAQSLLPLPSNYPGPMPAPTGEGRYFGYGSRVYDAAEDRWRGPSDVEWGPFWWGDSHSERWFSIGYWGEGRVRWLLLPPKIEYPPFAEETAFRVTGTGSCLRLREEPDAESHVLDCLPDGERLLFADSGVEVEQNWSGGPASPHSSIALEHYDPPASSRVWVYVRTEDGAEGWVSHDYLEHD